MQPMLGFQSALESVQTILVRFATNSMTGRLLVCTVLTIGVGHQNLLGGQVTMPSLTVIQATKNYQQTHMTLHIG